MEYSLISAETKPLSKKSYPALSARELEILDLISYGHSSKEVADILFVAKRTVDFHLRNVFSKLKVKNRMQAVRVAATYGMLVPPND